MTSDQKSLVVLVVEVDEQRAGVLRPLLSMMLPRCSTVATDSPMVTEGTIPRADAAVVDGGTTAKGTIDVLQAMRARGFEAPILVVTPVPDDSALRATMDSLGAHAASRKSIDGSPSELALALTAAVDGEQGLAAELRQARRIFAAGQAALSLQHAINNPLAALLAEAQLLQLDELTAEQRGAADRMVELCRRIVALVRRLDALVGS